MGGGAAAHARGAGQGRGAIRWGQGHGAVRWSRDAGTCVCAGDTLHTLTAGRAGRGRGWSPADRGSSHQGRLPELDPQVIAFGENEVYDRTPLVPGSFADRAQRLTKKVGPPAGLLCSHCLHANTQAHMFHIIHAASAGVNHHPATDSRQPF